MVQKSTPKSALSTLDDCWKVFSHDSKSCKMQNMFLKDQYFFDIAWSSSDFTTLCLVTYYSHIFFSYLFSDKESKIKYLEKVIDCVSFTLGDPVAAKPSKIVSGQEPQKTNEFLQAIAQIIEKKLGKVS